MIFSVISEILGVCKILRSDSSQIIKVKDFSNGLKESRWVDKHMVPLIIIEVELISPFLAGSPSDHTGLFHRDCSAVSSHALFVLITHKKRPQKRLAGYSTGFRRRWDATPACAKRFIISQ